MAQTNCLEPPGHLPGIRDLASGGGDIVTYRNITLIKQKEAATKCGVSIRKFADMVKEIDDFPQQKKMAHSARLKFFVAEEIDQWLHDQISDSAKSSYS